MSSQFHLLNRRDILKVLALGAASGLGGRSSFAGNQED